MSKLFPSQQPNEKIYVAAREHWFRLFLKYFIIFLLVLVPIPIKLFVVDPLDVSSNTSTILALISQVYYLGLIVASFLIWVLYYLNLHIVSEMRIVDIDQRGLLKHEVSELNLETIEDVTSDTTGLLGNVLNYGTVYIQTAGAVERFEFENIADPAKVANIILTLYERQRKLEGNPTKPNV
jgi:hypothetical protein